LIRLIANPAAGRGRARWVIPGARAAFAPLGAEVVETTRPGDEARLVREALAAGAETIVAIGGDGTWSKVAAAIVAARSACRLGLIAAGTGNDLAKNLAVPASDIGAMARLAAEGTTRSIDVGFVDDRFFVNCAGFGFDAAVLGAAEGRQWPRGDALYAWCAAERLFGYRGVSVASDDGPFRTHLLLVIANGERFGGSFRIAPSADMSDGAFDIVGVADASPLGRVRLFAAAVRGTHVGLRAVETRRAAAVRLRFREPPIFQVDGDLYRAATPDVTVRCVPRALRVLTSVTTSSDATSGSVQ
jgi:diacylglycerol kinase (ATP)